MPTPSVNASGQILTVADSRFPLSLVRVEKSTGRRIGVRMSLDLGRSAAVAGTREQHTREKLDEFAERYLQ